MKLVMNTYAIEDKCKLCIKIETKWGRIVKEQDRVKRWKKEDRHGRRASIAASEEAIEKLTGEMNDLVLKRNDLLLQTSR